jgi:membrane-associated phospholipid phosphatase
MAPLREVGDFVEPAGHMGNTNFWYLSGLAVSYTAGWERPTRIFAQILESHYIAGLGKNTVQYFVGRTRPHEGFGPREFGRDDATSFPSGHSSNVFQVATVLSHHVDNRWFDIAAYGTAGTVALQRIRSNAHWPSDVLLSSFYGWAVAKTVVKRHEERTAAGAGGMALEPHISPLGTGVQVAWRF